MENPLKDNNNLQEHIAMFLALGRNNQGRKSPTTKQIKVASAIVVGKSPTQALREAGYSESAIDKPNIITRSRGVAEALEILIGGKDMEIVKKTLDILYKANKLETIKLPYYPHKKKDEKEEEYKERIDGIMTDEEVKIMLVEAGGIVSSISNNSRTGRLVYYYFPNYQTRLKALDMIFRIKGSYAPTENKNQNQNVNLNFSPAMLRAEIEKRGIEIIGG